jgi:hypothetical protein
MSIHLPGEKVGAPQISFLSVFSVSSVVVLTVGLNLAKGLNHGIHGVHGSRKESHWETRRFRRGHPTGRRPLQFLEERGFCIQARDNR